jgi:hypothetical protein
MVAWLGGCDGEERKKEAKQVYPRMMALPDHKELILSRIEREPYKALFEEIEACAGSDYELDEDPDHWDPHANGRNGTTAMCNAFLAWIRDDEAAAEKARSFFDRLETDWLTNDIYDVHIRMPRPLIGYTNAWDLLMATDSFPAEEAEEARQKITDICSQFYDTYVEDDAYRDLILGLTQNNYSIRTASAIGYVALAFPDHPDAGEWADWAFSELDYLWGPDGCYVQPDGGVSEGPFYSEFAFAPSVALFIAHYNMFDRLGETQTYLRDCCNRVETDPWGGYDCADGEPFVFENPLVDESSRFHASAEWSVSLRLPWGSRPPLGDAYLNPFNGNALLTSFGGAGFHGWDWETNRDSPYETTHGMYLTAHHLIYYDDSVARHPPPWTTRFMAEAGNAVFRSGWSEEAIWLLLVAENGAVRKTVHDHVDGTSFSLAAYGEYLLIDPGYYKPDPTNNAKTCNSAAHNTLLVDGRGAPDKGLLTAFRDADAFLRNTVAGDHIEYAEAHQSYEDDENTQVERSVVFVDRRYFVVGDWVETDAVEGRVHTFRVNGYAGYGSGGAFELGEHGARWEREAAGVDVYVSATATPLAVVEPLFAEHEVPHVHQFELNREVDHHAVMDATALGRCPAFLSVLAPYSTDPAGGARDQPLAVDRIELGDDTLGWVVEIQESGYVDAAVLRTDSSPNEIALPTGSVLETDGRLAVVRFSGEGVASALLVRGTYLTVDGEALITSAQGGSVELWEQ